MSLKLIFSFYLNDFNIEDDFLLPNWWLNIKDVLGNELNSLFMLNPLFVVGYKTWKKIEYEIPETFNLMVLSENPVPNTNTITKKDFIELFIKKPHSDPIFIIGGLSIFKEFINLVQTVYAFVLYHQRREPKNIFSDPFFPLFNSSFQFDKKLEHNGSGLGFNFSIVKYRKHNNKSSDEIVYLNLLNKILSFGHVRKDRTGVGTYSIFAPDPLRFDLSRNTLPLITTKFVSQKVLIEELLWFLRGQTDSKILEKKGINIWKENTTRKFLNDRGLNHYEVGDVGPMYGINFRAFGVEYKGCSVNHIGMKGGVDQLNRLVEGLKKDPMSRRHIITTFDPKTVDQCVLYECHGIVIQMYVKEYSQENKTLSCHVYCRSQDVFLGQVYNIASYALFTHIIAEMTSMKADELILSMGDAHIYLNHVEQVKEQLNRNPLPFPKVYFSDKLRKPETKFEDIEYNDIIINGYLFHPAIKAPMAV